MNYWLSCALIFLFSFCSLSYELLLAKVLSDLSQNEILSQSLGIGVFLLGLGLGAGVCSLSKTSRPRLRLFRVEALMTAFVFVVGALAYGFGFLSLLPSEAEGMPLLFRGGQGGIYVFVGFMIFIVGFLSGYEFPLMLQSQGPDAKAHLALGVSYLGGLGAGFAVPFVLNPNGGPLKAIFLLGLLNFLLLGVLLFYLETGALRPRNTLVLLLPTAALCLGVFSYQPLEQAYLKVFYFSLRIPSMTPGALKNLWYGLGDIPPVERIYSPYQKIDLVRGSQRSSWARDPAEGVTLYLDRRLQFTESTFHLYHESMIYGAFNLAGRTPSRVLILGGGDGLLAAELLKHPEVRRIDLVELDPFMIRLANTHEDFLRLNGKALEDERVHVHITDAFSYMKERDPGSVDAVFIDFPYPHSPDLLRLYSVEFYEIVRRALSPEGFAIMDGPIYTDQDLKDRPMDVRPQWVIVNTLKAAGFRTVSSFGPYEGFYFFMPGEKKPRIDYERIPDRISNAALVNLKSTDHLLSVPEDFRGVNSLFRPYPVIPSE